MNETPQREPDVPVGDHDTPINPYVMQQLNHMRDRIKTQRATMEAMYNRLNPAAQFYDWVKETHPDILNQYTSIRELEEVGKDYGVSLKMGKHPFTSPLVKAEGQMVNYDGTL